MRQAASWPAAQRDRQATTEKRHRESRTGVESCMPPKVSDILKLLSDNGWYFVAMRGSHRQLKHPTKPGRVTVHGKPSDDIAPGTLNSILKQSGLKK
jgi:predicted RNA binding protein YcfA (HicA-like mRNA interferase family)